MVMAEAIRILTTNPDGDDGLIVTFSDGTTGAFVVEELLGLRPIREQTETRKTPDSLYDVHFKSGGMRMRVTERSLRGLRAEEIDWLWFVEQKRRATPEEIQKLCKGVSKR
jgi:hypothetical protein